MTSELQKLKATTAENLFEDEKAIWLERFDKAVAASADLSKVPLHFKYWLLTDETINPGINHPIVKKAISDVAEMIKREIEEEKISKEERKKLTDAARNAALSAAKSDARGAAWSAAKSAAWQRMANKLIELVV